MAVAEIVDYLNQMRTSLISIMAVLASVAFAADTPQTRPPSVAEIEGVRLEVEQPMHANELHIQVWDFSAANHRKEKVSCQIFYVSEKKEEWKVADFTLERVSGDRYSGTYKSGRDFVHGTVAKVIYKSPALELPISTWCMFAFH